MPVACVGGWPRRGGGLIRPALRVHVSVTLECMTSQAEQALAERKARQQEYRQAMIDDGIPASAASFLSGGGEHAWQAQYREAAWRGTFCGSCSCDLPPEGPVWLRRFATELHEDGVGPYYVTVPLCEGCGNRYCRDVATMPEECAVCRRQVRISVTRWSGLRATLSGKPNRIVCCGVCRRDRRRRRRRVGVRPATCKQCGARFQAKRSTATFCSGRCRVAAHRH